MKNVKIIFIKYNLNLNSKPFFLLIKKNFNLNNFPIKQVYNII